MITGLSHTTVWVLDQNSAKKFYTALFGWTTKVTEGTASSVRCRAIFTANFSRYSER